MTVSGTPQLGASCRSVPGTCVSADLALSDDAAAGWTQELPRSLESPAMARRAVCVLLVGWGTPPAVVEVAELLVSELVTNAVMHAVSRPCLHVTAVPPRLRISVRDSAADAPRLADTDDEVEGGRGLVLVQALASRWGTEADRLGKWVWFEVDLPSTQ